MKKRRSLMSCLISPWSLSWVMTSAITFTINWSVFADARLIEVPRVDPSALTILPQQVSFGVGKFFYVTKYTSWNGKMRKLCAQLGRRHAHLEFDNWASDVRINSDTELPQRAITFFRQSSNFRDMNAIITSTTSETRPSTSYIT